MALFIIGLLLFIGLVIIHEMGHFFAARRNGVEVEEFGIFFPPRLWKKKTKEGWDFTINALPLGGFVKLKGEYDADRRPGTFGSASDTAKIKIMLAGVFMNLVTALVLFTILALVGMPKIIENQFTVASDTKVLQDSVIAGYVAPNSPAAAAGIAERDELISISNGKKTYQITDAQLGEITKQWAGKTVTITFARDGQTIRESVRLLDSKTVENSLKTDNPRGYLGVQTAELSLQQSTWSAPIVALGLTAQLTELTLKGLGTALQGLGGIFAGALTGNTTARQNAQTDASSQVSGPLGIFFILKSGSDIGVRFMIFIIAIISLTLAIMNVLPIPALDGGRLFVMGIARLFKKPLTQQIEERVYGTGFLVLILLIIVITIVDVKRFF